MASAPAHGDPITVGGQIYITSAGGDFPDYYGPVNELIFWLSGAGLPRIDGAAIETIPVLGTRGNLQITRTPTPQPPIAGTEYSVSSRATFTAGRAFEQGWPDSGRAYDIAADFVFTGGQARLQWAPYDLLIGSAPVAFTGTLSGFDIDTGALLFSHSVESTGVGEVTFFPANPSFFQFEYSLQPVPEPSTLVTLGAGVAWLAVRAARRRPNGMRRTERP